MSKRLQDLVLAAVDAELTPKGFKLVKSKKWFLRKSDGRTEKFQLVILNDRPGHRVCPCVGVRFEEVEQIFHKTSTFAPEYKKDTSTVGVNLWHIHGKEGYQLPLHEESDVPMVVERILEVFQNDAEPYFAQFGELTAVDAAVNDQPTEKCIHRPLPPLRCSTGAIVAKLTGRADYKALTTTYREQLIREANAFYLPPFEALLEDLAITEANSK